MIIMDKSKLLAKCQAGDELAVEKLVYEFQPRLFRLALSILDDGSENGPADAEEITQDALLKALKSLDSFRAEAALSTWLYAITINLCRNRLRSRRRRRRMQQAFQDLTSLVMNKPKKPEEIVTTNEADTNVLLAVYALNDTHRIPVILRYYHACSIQEIAKILKVPEGTIHSRLNTARNQLKYTLQSELRNETNE
jgi:RNA polymerase sigma-70 factor (ECF subfamily)